MMVSADVVLYELFVLSVLLTVFCFAFLVLLGLVLHLFDFFVEFFRRHKKNNSR